MKEAVLKALDAAALSLRSKLGESLSSVQKYATPLFEATTPSLEALKAYSLGQKTRYAKGQTASLPFYKRAVELDPTPASAQACEQRKLKSEAQIMATIPLEITYSVETNASPAFAWHYWANIANWDDPPAEFELDGPFATGSRGVTRLPGQEPLHWLIREVTPPNAATIEMSLDGAALSFEWRFVGLADGRTQLTQRIVLKGEKADVYLSQVKAAFTANLRDGMNKLATAMANADPSRKSPD